MAVSKKLLIGLGATLATGIVVTTTAVELININKKATETKEEDGSVIKPDEDKTSQSSKNKTLQEIANSINKQNVEVKSSIQEGMNSTTVERSSVYAFNVQSEQLSLSSDVKLPDGVKTSFDLSSTDNNTNLLNSGKLKVKVTLTNSTSTEKGSVDIELDGFKASSATNGVFANLFEANGEMFVLKIEPSSQSSKYINLDFLNSQNEVSSELASRQSKEVTLHDSDEVVDNVDGSEDQTQAGLMHATIPVSSQGTSGESGGSVATSPSREDNQAAIDEASPAVNEQPVMSSKESGLTTWLKMDEAKKVKLNGISLVGQVKLANISKETSSNKTYFHLVSKDTNNRVKLVKGDEQILVEEIKTVNLLASDVTIVPTMIDKEGTNGLLETLKTLKNGEDEKESTMPNGYLQTNTNESLNRYLSVDLNASNQSKPEHIPNTLFIKPYLVKKQESNKTNLPVSLVVSFGKDDYLTTYRTDDETQLKVLKDAGFSFGIYSKKLSQMEKALKASVLTNADLMLSKYFKPMNYSTPSDRQMKTEGMETYPGGFSLNAVENAKLMTSFNIAITQPSDEKQSDNLLLFADYSYSGISMSNVLLAPLLSLFHLAADPIS